MAEAQEPTPAAQEPSMEEILASIRKIISDDGVPAEGAAAAPAPAPDPAQDVVELTQMVQDDGSVVDAKPAPPVEETPMPPEPSPPPVVAAPPKPVEKAESLVSEPAASTAATSLSALASTVEIERLASAPVTHTPFGNGARSLEDMVLELMRPMLREWLDKNLPGTVDRLVQKEIERISKKAQD